MVIELGLNFYLASAVDAHVVFWRSSGIPGFHMIVVSTHCLAAYEKTCRWRKATILETVNSYRIEIVP